MQALREINLTGTVPAGETSVTLTSDSGVLGRLYAVEWVDGTLADGVDAVLSVTNTPSGVNKTLLTLTDANDDAWYQPREDRHSNAGAAASANDQFMVIAGTLSLTISSAVAAQVGGAVVYYFV